MKCKLPQIADKTILDYVEILKQFKYNPALGTYFAKLLQLSNKKEIYSQYSLSDISDLYESLANLEEFNLDIYADAANFENSVMDNSEKVRFYISTGIAKAQQKIEELQHILDELEKS